MREKKIIMREGKTLLAKSQNKPIREKAKIIVMAQIHIWAIVKNKECTRQLSNTKWPERPMKTPEVNDHKILSLIRKNPMQ